MIEKIALSALLASTLVVSLNAAENKDDALVTHTELGYIETSGNTQTKTFNLDSKVKKGWGKHIFTLSFDGQYASDKEKETKNKYFAELEYDYDFTKRFSLNYLVGYKDDKFSNFDYQFYTGPGAKYKAIISDTHNLSLEGSFLYSNDRIKDTMGDGAGNIVSYPYPAGSVIVKNGYNDQYSAYRAKGIYSWQMLQNLKFNQELSYRGSFESASNYFIFSKTGFTSKLSDIFSAGLSYKVDYVNEPGDKEKTDTTFTVGIIIDY